MSPLLLILACGPGSDKATEGAARSPLATFPSSHLVDEAGRLAIPAGLLPEAEGGLPFPVERLAWREGFSSVQTTVIDPQVELDRTSLPTPEQVGEAGSVQLWDLDEGQRLPVFAELDAWCATTMGDEACADEVPRLLVRPLRPMPVGHRVAVVVTDQVRTADGQAWAGPQWWQDLAAGRPHPDLASWQEGTDEVLAQLEQLGVEGVSLVVDFPVGDGTRPTRAIAEQVQTPTSWSWRRTVDVDEGDSVPPSTWKQAEGSFLTDNWLQDGVQFELQDGLAQAQGQLEAVLYLHVPQSVRGAAPGTVPVWLFGHGIFSSPADYLGEDDDPSALLELADRAGAIVVATEWRGLCQRDLITAVGVGNDISRIPELTDKLAQGVANTIALRRLVTEGGLLDDPLLEGLADPSTLRYYGISLGGIEGAILMALDPAIPHGVLHVGGSSWSTMLERSSNWPTFEDLVGYGYESPADRQVLYSAMQLFWDEADPAGYAEDLRGRSVLWQESMGDEQVPNITTESLARAAGANLLTPSHSEPWDIPLAAAPLTGPALAQFDPQVGVPDPVNRPSPVSGAHGAPRHWDGTMAQILRFLDPLDPGVVEHFCGSTACAADNPG